ncbi:hypothetical protein NSB25_23790 [Acetatifactor muris]|nr:hypothetical protein [Acetatifactor muris]MCR2050273.1 hypothetical protein [Acetatifactor muris]
MSELDKAVQDICELFRIAFPQGARVYALMTVLKGVAEIEDEDQAGIISPEWENQDNYNWEICYTVRGSFERSGGFLVD